MAKILVVDDETDLEVLIKQKFRKKIRNNDYEFVFAINGNDALMQLEKHNDVDVVLSDINMPEMDGLTLLTKLNEQHSILKPVIVSAYGDMDNIRTAMNRGAFDFVTKPIEFEDLELTITKTLEHLKLFRGLKEEKAQAERAQATLSRYFSPNVVETLSPVYGDECPVAVVYRASWPDEQIIRGTLTDLQGQVLAKSAGHQPPFD